ncbi:hypothetical protein ABIF65_000310 [Bradyrhizobium japonicum]|uniref:hypothetical protein n=1 Tax=Bradyrhizobium TaxID=374 RepID=UPI0004208AC3|nr:MULTISPECIES: hypothetical protein [Bradyrhizobium]MBR0883621.1 hypothetical protein [Bradyrhizobium liaoningense]MBR0948104.1 hypothetical protein [Bradyrhizobium liaoningense]MBR1004202.1 hypothetical protein [Bradyrhizobium liaoningense]MBR1034546.1 hypothetical protein [Bradyrhizobium liaoningense]MBR1064764.1 hypothetical protein [Bradyrhizobium liaoningense]
MPQIWMTYDELATLSGCSAAEARMQAMHLSLDRRKSRDGNTRVKLNLALMARFFETVREAEFDLDDAITALRNAHRQMSGVLSTSQPSLRRGVA